MWCCQSHRIFCDESSILAAKNRKFPLNGTLATCQRSTLKLSTSFGSWTMLLTSLGPHMPISVLVEQSLNDRLPADLIRERQQHIAQRILIESKLLRQENFQVLCIEDLKLLYQLYDEIFCQSAISSEICRTKSELTLRLGNRLTSAGAKTTIFRRYRRTRYDIAFSTMLLAQSFTTPGQAHWVAGLLCDSRLQALQRLMEHELIHVIELLAFGKSSCGARRFKQLATNLFRHACSHHRLISPGDRLRTELGLRVGDHVSFHYGGQRFSGRINRITKRATILVPDARGHRYTDGGRYRKFLVPVVRLISAGDGNGVAASSSSHASANGRSWAASST